MYIASFLATLLRRERYVKFLSPPRISFKRNFISADRRQKTVSYEKLCNFKANINRNSQTIIPCAISIFILVNYLLKNLEICEIFGCRWFGICIKLIFVCFDFKCRKKSDVLTLGISLFFEIGLGLNKGFLLDF